MELLGKRIRQFREYKGLSQSEIEKRTGIKREYLSKIETDDLKNPTYFTLVKIAKGLGVSIAELLETVESITTKQEPVIEIVSSLKQNKRLKQGVEAGKYIAIPIIEGEIAAGNPTYISEGSIQDYALIFSSCIKPTTDFHRYRCVWVQKGSRSMSPVIEPGSLVCIDSYQRDPKLLEGKIVAMRDEDGGCTIRYLRLEKSYILGIPENIKEYEPLIFPYRENRSNEKNPIVGKVVWYWSVLDN
jgi:transcriptional regulator with XRE-family HTH domain